MSIELSSDRAQCTRCGTAYGRRKGNFPVNYSILYKGLGYIPICKDCIDAMYNAYLAQCGDARDAVHQMCRKLDLYWSDRVFDIVASKNTARSMMTQYIAKTNTSAYLGKSYDDTLNADGTMWSFSKRADAMQIEDDIQTTAGTEPEFEDEHVDPETEAFWGPGYTSKMYGELEQRRRYWMSRFPEDTEFDIGTEALIRQICSLEIDINRDRASGRSVDKSITALNTLLGSANLKPAQRKQDDGDAYDNTPFGVWIRRWEDMRPVPEPDPELADVDGIIKYIEVWFKGHLAKMLGLKNAYSKLYQKEIDKIRVDHPEYDDEEEDEEVFSEIFGGDDSEQI